MTGLKLTTDAAVEPVSLAEAKAFLAIDTADTANDVLISALIKAARKFCENYTKRAFITQTWDMWLDQFPAGTPASKEWWDGTREGSISQFTGSLGCIEFPRAPLQSIVSLETFGGNDAATAFDVTALVVNTAVVPGRVFPKVGQIWPVDLRPNMAIHIQFKAGYGDASASVPDDLIQACKLMLGFFFENRGPQSGEVPLAVRMLLDNYVVRSL